MNIKIGDIDVYYVEHGAGFPIINIHGFYPDHRLMTGCLEPLFETESQWRRIYLDLPGMGQTKASDTIQNSDDMLALVLKFIEAIIPNQDFLITGESYGGYIASGVIREWGDRVKGAAFICPMIVPEADRRDVPVFNQLELEKGLKETMSEAEQDEFLSFAIVANQYTWGRYQKEIMPAIAVADVDFLENFRQYGFRYSFDKDGRFHKPFQQPALFVLGRQDTSTGYKDAYGVQDLFPRATCAIIDKAGHNAQVEQSEIFNVLVRNWLQRVKEIE